ncbi:MAG TPA: TlyA family RNA methyltransferase [Acidimicrobiales bacterium]|nr:TlyA family RNA methyltransferase [Acidimicrobiales bacterium]
MTTRRRLDAEMVRRGLVPTREQAQDAIAAGSVVVGGAVANKAARMVAAGEPVEILGPAPRFVSRGGLKLDAALDRFDVDPTGKTALDAGASTGGFTDCLLQRGAASVVAVDVGRGQLHERLRNDPRVRVVEQTNVRHLDVADLDGAPFPLVTVDLSFISLATVAPAVADRLAAPGADVVTLVKPQFEAGRREVSRGKGVVRDPEVWSDVLARTRSALAAQGAAMMDAMVSPLLGADGNVEFLAHFRAHSATDAGVDLDGLVAAAAALAAERV